MEFVEKKWLISLLYRPIEKVAGITKEQLASIFAAQPLAERILVIVNDFKSLLKSKDSSALQAWMEKASALALPEINAFISGLKQDFEAVKNAIATNFNNGLAEGTVNKIKVIKRVMYGRCHFKTLKNKCLLIGRL